MVKNDNVNFNDDNGRPQVMSVNYISGYASDEAMNQGEVSALSTLLVHTLGLPADSADMVAEIMFEDRWSKKRARDAVKYVYKTQKYKTILPSDILSYDKKIYLLTYQEMLNFGTGGSGYMCVYVPGLPRTIQGNMGKDVGWWIRDGTIIPDNWKRR